MQHITELYRTVATQYLLYSGGKCWKLYITLYSKKKNSPPPPHHSIKIDTINSRRVRDRRGIHHWWRTKPWKRRTVYAHRFETALFLTQATELWIDIHLAGITYSTEYEALRTEQPGKFSMGSKLLSPVHTYLVINVLQRPESPRRQTSRDQHWLVQGQFDAVMLRAADCTVDCGDRSR